MGYRPIVPFCVLCMFVLHMLALPDKTRTNKHPNFILDIESFYLHLWNFSRHASGEMMLPCLFGNHSISKKTVDLPFFCFLRWMKYFSLKMVFWTGKNENIFLNVRILYDLWYFFLDICIRLESAWIWDLLKKTFGSYK